MISFIEGIVEEAGPLEVVLNCHGVGYRIDVPVTTAEKVPPQGQKVRLHVQAIYREDSQALYGFITREERDFFHLVTSKVSGIGPKIGLNLLSRLSFSLLRDAIARGDVALLSKCPGIGKKTAERLCIELKDTIGLPGGAGAVGSASSAGSTEAGAEAALPAGALAYRDAVQALMTLGFKMDAADKAVHKASQALGSGAGADALIKAALRNG